MLNFIIHARSTVLPYIKSKKYIFLPQAELTKTKTIFNFNKSDSYLFYETYKIQQPNTNFQRRDNTKINISIHRDYFEAPEINIQNNNDARHHDGVPIRIHSLGKCGM